MEPSAYTELDLLESTHWWYKGMRGMTDALLRRHLPKSGGLNILDAGCGTGGNLEALAPFGRVVGLDYSPLALQYTARKHAGKVLGASVTHLPFPDRYFDLVTSFDVLVMVEDDRQAMREFQRVLKPNGWLFLRLAAMPNLRGSHDDYVHSIRRYTAPELRAKLTEAGFKIHQLSYANSLLLPMIYGLRSLQNQRGGMSSDVNPTSEPLNSLLAGVLGLETAWLKRGGAFPAGVSLVAVGQK